MDVRVAKLALLVAAFLIPCGCSNKIMQPVPGPWQSVPCEYRLDGDDGSTLSVRAQVAEFDSAKIILNTFSWTVLGDTLHNQATFCPRSHERSGTYTVFTSNRPLPINSVIRSVELLIRRSSENPRRRDRP